MVEASAEPAGARVGDSRRYGDATLASLVAPGQQEPDWLASARKIALGSHQMVGIPNPKHEEWKYTPLRTVAEREWHRAEPGPAVFQHPLPEYTPGAARAVLVNGRLDRNLTTEPPAGVRVEALSDAVQRDDETVRRWLGKVGPSTTYPEGRTIEPDVHTFAELNLAAFEDGVFVHVGPGTVAAGPLEIVHVAAGDGAACFPRVLIVVEPGARLEVVETYVSDGAGGTLCLPVTEVVVSEAAEVEHVRVQLESDASIHIGSWQATQATGSAYQTYNVCYGGALARLDHGVWLDGEDTETRMDGVVVASDGQHMDNHTRLDHAHAHGSSFETYKQIAADGGHVVFNGKIFVHQDAQKTDAKQTNQALLLGPGAVIDSKPQLEIFADDVKCTHGATVGQIEDLPLFYLTSRGVPRKQAEAVLVYAFAAEVLERIQRAGVRTALEERLFAKLGVPRA
jgi:Fe-S cluster assembly protein SufD